MYKPGMAGFTLAQARKWLGDRLDKGETCPCCDQFAKIYKRAITKNMANILTVLPTRDAEGEPVWFKGSEAVKDNSGDLAKLRYWGLIEEEKERRPDGGRSGWWRVTPLGRKFLMGKVTVSKYAVLYNGKLIDFEGAQVNIRELLPFRFDTLMDR